MHLFKRSPVVAGSGGSSVEGLWSQMGGGEREGGGGGAGGGPGGGALGGHRQPR